MRVTVWNYELQDLRKMLMIFRILPWRLIGNKDFVYQKQIQVVIIILCSADTENAGQLWFN